MQILSVGELKSKFSEALVELKKGREIIVSYGKKREKVAVLVPYRKYAEQPARKLGLLKDRGRCIIHDDFKTDDNGFLAS